MKFGRLSLIVGSFLVFSGWGFSQQVSGTYNNSFFSSSRSEVFAEGSGVFTSSSYIQTPGVNQQATNSGGFAVGYRYHLSPWHNIEGRYGYTRNEQRYIYSSTVRNIQTNMHEMTFTYVLTVPKFGRLVPFAAGGGGALFFKPTNNAGGSVSGAQSQTKGSFVWGGGLDYGITPNLSLRAEYRGLDYKIPNFKLGSIGLHTNKWALTSEPLVGLVFRF